MPKYEPRPQQLCWSCLNAVPSEITGQGCEWSRDLTPVPGWDAEMVSKGSMGLAWCIERCPKYETEPPRRAETY